MEESESIRSATKLSICPARKAANPEVWYSRSSNRSCLFHSGLQKVAREVKAEVDEKNRLLVELDVHEFEPEEITVKAIENQLIVHAKKETQNCCKEFRREIQLPDGIDLDTVTSNLSPSGE